MTDDEGRLSEEDSAVLQLLDTLRSEYQRYLDVAAIASAAEATATPASPVPTWETPLTLVVTSRTIDAVVE